MDHIGRILIESEVRHSGLSEKTQEKYIKWNIEMSEYIGKPIEKIEEADIKKYLKHKKESGKISKKSLLNIEAGVRYIAKKLK